MDLGHAGKLRGRRGDIADAGAGDEGMNLAQLRSRGDCGEGGVLDLAALLGWGQGTFASKDEVAGDDVNVTREVDGGLETVKLKLPAVVTTDLRLNEPRYASLPNIMKAKSKPLATKSPADYGVDVARRLETVKVTEPPKRQAGIKVAAVDELSDRLKTAGVVG